MKVMVKTEKYQWVHGRKPRGWGTWLFEIAGKMYGFTNLYQAAKEQAVRTARELEAEEVVILP